MPYKFQKFTNDIERFTIIRAVYTDTLNQASCKDTERDLHQETAIGDRARYSLLFSAK